MGNKYSVNMTVILCFMFLCVSVVKSNIVHSEDILRSGLPLSKLQLRELASDVCMNLNYSDQPVADLPCKEFFLSTTAEVSSAAHIDIKCRGEKSVTFTIEPSEYTQLVLAVPEENYSDLINYSLLDPYVQSGTIALYKQNYTLWSTYLRDKEMPSKWNKGPKVPPWESNVEPIDYNIEIILPFTKYNEETKTLDAQFKWNTFYDADYCFDVLNYCQKHIQGSLYNTQIGPLDERVIVLDNLLPDDDCTFQVEGRNGKTELNYHTPPCSELRGCRSGPSIPQNVSLSTSPSAVQGWDVHVGWSIPKQPPELYNITVFADTVNSVLLNGNLTEATIRNVTGDGLYTVLIEAINNVSTSRTSRESFFPEYAPESSSMPAEVAAAWCGTMLLCAMFATAVWFNKRRRQNMKRIYLPALNGKEQKEFNSSEGIDTAVEDNWEIRPERLMLHDVIGEGAFGVVRRGILGGKEVAVKMLKDFPSAEEVRSFRREMETMKGVGAHPHIVSLVGCCSGRRPLIVAEYCRGDLLTYLRSSWDAMTSKLNNNPEHFDFKHTIFKDDKKPTLVINKLYDLERNEEAELTPLDLLSFCRQIAMGMEYLALNRVVHRDLAARNILISGDKTLKIADFGLSRDVYQQNLYKQEGNEKMPIKWMALESLTRRIYTTQSDVWSFGVVIWEVVTLGGAPYPEVPPSRLPRLLRAGYRMPRPSNCSRQLYELMQSCWRARPRDRPTFSELHALLDELLNTACVDQYLSLQVDDDVSTSPALSSRKYGKMLLGKSKWAWRNENYERPLQAPSNHYTSTPVTLSPPQIV